MNKANLKSYAPKARLDFIKAVTERANVLGISAAGALPAEVRGDVAIIDGREWPAKVAGQREELLSRIKRHGFEQTMDEVAYTWFNRFAALRYMEIHDYLDHGWRVLSSRDGGLPEILRHASEVSLPGLNADRAREMQLAGNQDNELYKLLLVAQCNELSRVMPFLFERIDDDTELLLPENLLRTDSIVAKLVESVPEEDWQEIEVIGWLYQFYISEKKDQVIGKVVKSEDIPAATQLFTPNWIVQYLVQNSVGRLWLMANPTSTLANQWPYYIQPAEQTPEVQAQLDALIQTRVREDGETLNPETITVLDPACGSGHILVVAYDVLKAIYLERGYQPRTIPRLILEKNLYGLDIDDRAAQLAAFALLMKARADDRRLFADPPKLNVLSLKESKGLDLDELVTHLGPFGLQREPLKVLLGTFEFAKTFGSLIQIPAELYGHMEAMLTGIQQALREGDLYAQQSARDFLPLLLQSMVLATPFDAVVANPPYMGNKYFDGVLRRYAESNYERGKYDLFSIFIERACQQLKQGGHAALVTIQNWMFLSSFSAFREYFLQNFAIRSLIQIGYNSFPEINSKVAQAAAFCFQKSPPGDANGVFINLNSDDFSADKKREFLSRDGSTTYMVAQKDFLALDGVPVAYSLGKRLLRLLSTLPTVQDVCDPREGINTGDNDRFMRLWYEVSLDGLTLPAAPTSELREGSVNRKWYPCNKGGPYRRWYGNNDYVVDWSNDGYDIKNLRDENGALLSRPQNTGYFFREGVTWSGLGQLGFSARYFPKGFAFNSAGRSAFSNGISVYALIAALNSSVSDSILKILAPTLSFTVGNIGRLPFEAATASTAAELAGELIEISKADWDSFETSWDFVGSPLLEPINFRFSLAASWKSWEANRIEATSRVKALEAKNNRIFIEAFGLENEVSTDVSEYQITLSCADREKDCQRLISYAIGCMMGRYSLDEQGLIYAYAGNIGFNPSRYEKKFPADSDGIVPLIDEPWFADDAGSRVREFLRTIWGQDSLEENMAWLAESLGVKGSETPDETIRRYLADKFFKDHLKTYKKRPIYWLFSSGKQGAFQALVYLHRYNEGTLARMRAEYVVPLISKMVSRLEMLNQDVAAASSAAARTKLQKQIEALRKKQLELLTYDEKLRHYADMRITLDLDDGVKVNYAKFGDLVAESKVITGGSDE